MYSLGITLFELFTNEILPTPHHEFQISRQRLQRSGNVISELHELGYGILPSWCENLFIMIYDMFLTSPSGRPSSVYTQGSLKTLIKQLEIFQAYNAA